MDTWCLSTSPFSLHLNRLEAESPSQLDPASLMSHMESASISNELLRQEIKTLQTTQTELRSQLDEARGQQEQWEVIGKTELEQGVEIRRRTAQVG